MFQVLSFCEICHPAQVRTGENLKNAPAGYTCTVIYAPLGETSRIGLHYCEQHLLKGVCSALLTYQGLSWWHDNYSGPLLDYAHAHACVSILSASQWHWTEKGVAVLRGEALPTETTEAFKVGQFVDMPSGMGGSFRVKLTEKRERHGRPYWCGVIDNSQSDFAGQTWSAYEYQIKKVV